MGISGNKSSRAAYAPSVFIKQTQFNTKKRSKTLQWKIYDGIHKAKPETTFLK